MFDRFLNMPLMLKIDTITKFSVWNNLLADNFSIWHSFLSKLIVFDTFFALLNPQKAPKMEIDTTIKFSVSNNLPADNISF